MKLGSMFAGIGGFDLAGERAGMESLWAVEKDPAARKLLRVRFPQLEVLEDVTQVDPGGLRRVDVLTAGWPCQDFSVAGRRAGLAGERSGLWREVVRWLDVLRPTWFVGENVPGLLSLEGGRDMGTVLWQLGQLGYGFSYRVLDARYCGVAQRRRRVLIVGCLGDPARAAQVLLEPEGGEWHPAASGEAGADVAHAVRASTGERGSDDPDRVTCLPEVASTLRGAAGGASHNKVNGTDRMTFVPEVFTRATTTHAPLGEGDPDRWEEASVVSPRTSHSPVERELVVTDGALVAPTLAAHKGWRLNGANDQLVVTDTLRSHPRPGSATTGAIVVAHTLRAEGADASEDGTGRGTPLVVAGTLAPGAHPGGLTGREAESGQLVVSRPLTAHPAGCRMDGESDQFVVSPTPRGFGHGWQGQHNDDAARMHMVRRLTPMECERLQGFPNGWTEDFSDSVRYRMLGNAVAVPMAEWVLRRLARVAAQR